jgi:uncharacterized Ntn-hydrolase superfamily protein
MRRTLTAGVLVLASASPASATWSVMALDQKSGTIVVASAGCVAQQDLAAMRARDLMDIQAIVVPGKAVAVVQGTFDSTRELQRLMYAELVKGTDPEQILETILRQDSAIGTRQVAMLDVDGRRAGFTGPGTNVIAAHDQGQVAGTDIWYSVQGDNFATDEVVRAAVQALADFKEDLAERVMTAMEAIDAKGGDRRCSCASDPKPSAPCETRTAHAAYILRADKSDNNRASYNDGRYAMYLSVSGEHLKPTESPNAVKTLRTRYDEWKRTRPN